MSKKILLHLLLLIFTMPLKAQVEGYILDAETRQPLAGATVVQANGDQETYSRENGGFGLNITLPDTLMISNLGYKTQLVPVSTSNVTIYMEQDYRLLSEIIISAFENEERLLEVPAAVAILKPEAMQLYDETSIFNVMNAIPGVRMEQRSPGSFRINIRGSALRAPFDVRNVKVYWNGIPFTEPGGNTPFNLFDVINFGKIEVIKGPGGSIYGAGTGGVINIHSDWPVIGERSLKAGFTAGSYGLRRYTASFRAGNEKNSWMLNYANQKADGYREHSALDRDVVELNGKFFSSGKSTLSTHMLYTNLFYNIPGGLNREQYEDNPRQARPGNAFTLGSIESNASINVENFLMGFTHEYYWNKGLSNKTTIYGIISDFKNPFILDFKREAQQGAGGRSIFHYDGEIANIPGRLTLGGEFQTRFAAASNFGNNRGKPDTLNFEDELRTKQAIAFAQAELKLPYGFNFSAGLSFNKINYNIFRLVDAATDSSFRIERGFSPEWMPRIGLIKKLGSNLALRSSVSYGFSPPTLEEVRTNEGSINLGLDPEKGINYELGIRGIIINDRINFDLTAFYFRLDETILDFTSPRGTDLFRNAGNTNQTGLELSTQYILIDNPKNFISKLDIQISYTFHRFKFDDYARNDEVFSGNDLPGVAPHTVVLALTSESRPGLYANLNYNYTGHIPLNDANTVFSDDYHLALLKIGFKKAVTKAWWIDVFAGADNLLDQKYSLGNDLNAFGGRYFQPAAERNYYSGIKIQYFW